MRPELLQKRAGWAMLSLLLVACGSDGTATQPQTYSILSVLPTPVTPGTVVTAYGAFPRNTAQLSLDGRMVPVSAVQDGLQFTVPADLLAGSFNVSVPAAKGTAGNLEVRPRLDTLSVTGGTGLMGTGSTGTGLTGTGLTLNLRGAGWGAAPLSSAVSVDVGGRGLLPELTPDGLRVTLPADLGGNGSYVVRVRVGGNLSNARSFSREAGHLSGKVLRPLQGQRFTSQGLQRQALQATDRSYVSILVPEGTVMPDGANSTPLPALRLTRLTFVSFRLAQQALNALIQAGVTAQPDYPVHLDGSLATLAVNPTPSQQWFWPLMGLPQAWQKTRGAGVTVAVVDTGVLLAHPAFAGRLWPGWNVVDNTDQPNDVAGHGTHVAGLVAASGDTASGVQVSGAAPAAMLLPVKVLRDLSGGTVSDLAQGILWAVNDLPGHPNPHPAQVINLSLGTAEASEVLANAVARAQQQGALVVAATGNDGGPLYYPAALPGVMAVTSVSGPTLTYQPSYANRGVGTRIAAYGGDQGSDQDGNGVSDGVISTDLDTKGEASYAFRQGTSMAAPQVSGLAALALSTGTLPALLAATLQGHASDLGYQGFDTDTGWGVASADPARVDTPRMYVLARDAAGRVLNWTTGVGGGYLLSNLPSGTTVTVTAMTDQDNDGLLGEAGDLGSDPLTVTVANAGAEKRDLQLHPLDGAHPLTLAGQGE